jgi:hypothetical protein
MGISAKPTSGESARFLYRPMRTDRLQNPNQMRPAYPDTFRAPPRSET